MGQIHDQTPVTPVGTHQLGVDNFDGSASGKFNVTALQNFLQSNLTFTTNTNTQLSESQVQAFIDSTYINGLTIDADTVTGFTVGTNVPADAVFTDTDTNTQLTASTILAVLNAATGSIDADLLGNAVGTAVEAVAEFPTSGNEEGDVIFINGLGTNEGVSPEEGVYIWTSGAPKNIANTRAAQVILSVLNDGSNLSEPGTTIEFTDSRVTTEIGINGRVEVDTSGISGGTGGAGDITAVNVTAPITGGGTTGAVTVGIDQSALGITASQVSDFDTEVGNNTAVAANTAKVGITPAQATDITTNTAKTGITSDQATAITTNTAKVGITTAQAGEITTNTAKVTFPGLGTSSTTALAGDTDVDNVDINQYDTVTTAADDDFIIIQDTSDSNANKKITKSNFQTGLGGGGGLTAAQAIGAVEGEATLDLTGVPTAPTAAVGTDTTQIATTQFVLANGGGGVTFTIVDTPSEVPSSPSEEDLIYTTAAIGDDNVYSSVQASGVDVTFTTVDYVEAPGETGDGQVGERTRIQLSVNKSELDTPALFPDNETQGGGDISWATLFSRSNTVNNPTGGPGDGVIIGTNADGSSTYRYAANAGAANEFWIEGDLGHDTTPLTDEGLFYLNRATSRQFSFEPNVFYVYTNGAWVQATERDIDLAYYHAHTSITQTPFVQRANSLNSSHTFRGGDTHTGSLNHNIGSYTTPSTGTFTVRLSGYLTQYSGAVRGAYQVRLVSVSGSATNDNHIVLGRVSAATVDSAAGIFFDDMTVTIGTDVDASTDYYLQVDATGLVDGQFDSFSFVAHFDHEEGGVVATPEFDTYVQGLVTDTDNYVDGGSVAGTTLTLTRTGTLPNLTITGLPSGGGTGTFDPTADINFSGAISLTDGDLTAPASGVITGVFRDEDGVIVNGPISNAPQNVFTVSETFQITYLGTGGAEGGFVFSAPDAATASDIVQGFNADTDRLVVGDTTHTFTAVTSTSNVFRINIDGFDPAATLVANTVYNYQRGVEVTGTTVTGCLTSTAGLISNGTTQVGTNLTVGGTTTLSAPGFTLPTGVNTTNIAVNASGTLVEGSSGGGTVDKASVDTALGTAAADDAHFYRGDGTWAAATGGSGVTGITSTFSSIEMDRRLEITESNAGLVITSTVENDSDAPDISLVRSHNNIEAGDELGSLYFLGSNDNSGLYRYGAMFAAVDSSTDGSEAGSIYFQTSLGDASSGSDTSGTGESLASVRIHDDGLDVQGDLAITSPSFTLPTGTDTTPLSINASGTVVAGGSGIWKGENAEFDISQSAGTLSERAVAIAESFDVGDVATTTFSGGLFVGPGTYKIKGQIHASTNSGTMGGNNRASITAGIRTGGLTGTTSYGTNGYFRNQLGASETAGSIASDVVQVTTGTLSIDLVYAIVTQSIEDITYTVAANDAKLIVEKIA